MYHNFEAEEQKENSDSNNNGNQQDPEYRGNRLPFHIKLWRNRCIIALILQAVVSLSGFVMYTVRRMRVGQIVNIMCILMIIFFGRGGVLTLNKMHITVHGVVIYKQKINHENYLETLLFYLQITTSVFSVVLLYSILEILFLRFLKLFIQIIINKYSQNFLVKKRNQIQKRLMEMEFEIKNLLQYNQNLEEESSERLMLFIFSIPYVADLVCGACFLYLSVILYESQKQETKLDIPQINDSQTCVICANKQINTVFYPCGHRASCYECSLKIKQSYKMECPFCRQTIKDLIVVYDP